MRVRFLYCCIALALLLLPDNRCDAQYDWHKQDAGLPAGQRVNILHSVHFQTSNHGAVVGDLETILRTTDGGAKWTRTHEGYVWSLNTIQFIDNNVGFAVGGGGIILRTTDGGESWSSLIFRDAVDLVDVSFADALTGMAVGNRGVSGNIYRTTDGGENWTSVAASPTSHTLNAIHLFDVDNAIVVGPCESILLTSDGGKSWWARWADLCGRDFLEVSFVDGLNGFIVGKPGMILRSTDGGLTWAEQQSGTSVALHGVSFSDPNHGTAVGQAGTIVRTTNGGQVWERSTSGITNDLYDVCFTDANTGTAVGDKATILRTTTGGATWIPNDRLASVKSYLQPNYPNPFSTGTTIPITLDKTEYVSLRIFDAFGREISTLADGPREAGSHTLTWQARDLPAGVYYAVLRAGQKYEARTLVLIDTKP